MNTILFLCTSAIYLTATQAALITTEDKNKCVKDNGVSQEVLDRVHNHENVDTPEFEKASICFLEQAGVLDSKEEKLDLNVLKMVLENETGDDEERAFVLMQKCYYKKTTFGKTVVDLLHCLCHNGIDIYP